MTMFKKLKIKLFIIISRFLTFLLIPKNVKEQLSISLNDDTEYISTKEETEYDSKYLIGGVIISVLLGTISMVALKLSSPFFIFLTICILLNILYFICSPERLKLYVLNLVLYFLVQIGVMYWLAIFLQFKSDNGKPYIQDMTYIVLSYFVIGGLFALIKIRGDVQASYLKKESSKIKSIFNKKINSILIGFIFIIIIALQFVRINKSWLQGKEWSGLYSSNNFIVLSLWGAGLFILLVILTLLPTLIINISSIINLYFYGKNKV